MSVSEMRKENVIMYKKAVSLLAFANVIFALGTVCVRGIEEIRLAAWPVNQLKLELEQLEKAAFGREMGSGEYMLVSRDVTFAQGLGIADVAVSEQRVVDYSVVEKTPLYEFSDDEMEVLLRIVEAEAGSEDEDGRLLVANVILNRVESDRFPDNVTDVVFQQSGGVTQFSPVASGRYYKVKISEETVSAVGRALMGEDISQGALFFASRKYAGSEKMRWFEEKLTFLFAHGGHEFYK